MSPELIDAFDWAARMKEKAPDFIPTKHATVLVDEIKRLEREIDGTKLELLKIREWYEKSPLYIPWRGPIG